MKKEYKDEQITLEELNNLKELINKIDEDGKTFALTKELINEKEKQLSNVKEVQKNSKQN